MSERKIFKTRMLGFDRRDVTAYIAELAGERNEYIARTKCAEGEIIALKAENEGLRAGVEASRKMLEDFKRTELDEARAVMAELRRVYDDVRSDMDVSAAHISGELHRLGDTLTLLSQVLATTGARLTELDAVLDREQGESAPEEA